MGTPLNDVIGFCGDVSTNVLKETQVSDDVPSNNDVIDFDVISTDCFKTFVAVVITSEDSSVTEANDDVIAESSCDLKFSEMSEMDEIGLGPGLLSALRQRLPLSASFTAKLEDDDACFASAILLFSTGPSHSSSPDGFSS